MRLVRPYHRLTRQRCQRTLGSLRTAESFFNRFPLIGRSAAAFTLWRREGEQVGIEPQPGDDADVFAHRGEEFDGGKGAVGDQNDVAIGQPAVDLQGGLPRPIDAVSWASAALRHRSAWKARAR